jgi:hypothetical protein
MLVMLLGGLRIINKGLFTDIFRIIMLGLCLLWKFRKSIPGPIEGKIIPEMQRYSKKREAEGLRSSTFKESAISVENKDITYR